MPISYTAPQFTKPVFTCPHCSVAAAQHWSCLSELIHGKSDNYWVSACANCESPAFWRDRALFYPMTLGAEDPNDDLPDDIKNDYLEAAHIVTRSPRGAAALLRLCIQKLCSHLGHPGKNINDDIAALVKAGLPQKIQQALDVVRVIGNNAVHPGAMDLQDDKQVADSLFRLVNMIANATISEPKAVEDLYNTLPQSTLDAIENRDK